MTTLVQVFLEFHVQGLILISSPQFAESFLPPFQYYCCLPTEAATLAAFLSKCLYGLSDFFYAAAGFDAQMEAVTICHDFCLASGRYETHSDFT